MDFSSVNFVAVIVCVVLNVSAGFIWYHPAVFFKPWWRGTGKSESEQANPSPMLYVWTLLAAFVEGVFVSSPDFSAFGSDYNEKFLPAYEAKFGSFPLSIFHAHAYDAMNMLLACIENPSVTFKSEDGTLHIGRQALRDCMYATTNFAGLTGTLTCSQYGDCGAPVIAAYQYHVGEYPPEKVRP